MRVRIANGVLVILFAVALGHLAWNAVLGPAPVPDYPVGGLVQILSAPRPNARQLYLRRQLFLNQLPRHAWLQVLGRDQVRVHINGQLLDWQNQPGFPVGLVVDLAPALQQGVNVIAITARQTSVGYPPAVAVDGAYTLDDGEHRLQSDNSWRYSEVFERRSHWWFETTFDDRGWPLAQVTPTFLQGKVLSGPPRAKIAASQAHWITPPAVNHGSGALRGQVEVARRPRQAWLRVTATAAYRLAINGILLDEQEDQLGTTAIVSPVQRTYDITPLVQRGRNVVAAVLTSTVGAPPHLLADMEVEDLAGERFYLATDKNWLGCAGQPIDWLETTSTSGLGWSACTVEAGDLDILPWQPRREVIALSLPFAIVLQRLAEQITVMLVIALLTMLACRWSWHFLSLVRGQQPTAEPARIVYLALALPSLAIGGALLAISDPRVGKQDVYRSTWVVLAVLSVPVQWAILALLSFSIRRQPPTSSVEQAADASRRLGLIGWLMIALFVVGFALRLNYLNAEPLYHDEALHYLQTKGVLKRGFPSMEIHPDLPVHYAVTSELTIYGNALAALVFDDPRYVTRVPALFWGTLTIPLIYLVGRTLFHPVVGVIAAAIYTFSPFCIQIAVFGRYLSQLQFFTLLTLYFFWRTIRGTGPIDRRALWLTAVSFIATYFSWEIAALIAPGMMLAAVIQRRGRLRTMLCHPSVWAGMLVVGLVILLQYSARKYLTTRVFMYGLSATDVVLMPMWLYPSFQPLFYFWTASWSRDALLPMLGLFGSAILAIRHTFRVPTRFLLVILVTTCLVMGLFLPVMEWRYGYYLIPLLILLASAALTAGARYLVYQTGQIGLPRAWHVYARSVALVTVLVVLLLGSGLTVRLVEMTNFRIVTPEAGGLELLKHPDYADGIRYLRAHLRDGDVVMSNRPHLVDVLLGQRTDYWPQTSLYYPALLDDRRSVPIHVYSGGTMLGTRSSAEDLFSRHERIWYIAVPSVNSAVNDDSMSSFLGEHMDVVYENFQVVVLLRGENHRTAQFRINNARALRDASVTLVPGGDN